MGVYGCRVGVLNVKWGLCVEYYAVFMCRVWVLCVVGHPVRVITLYLECAGFMCRVGVLCVECILCVEWVLCVKFLCRVGYVYMFYVWSGLCGFHVSSGFYVSNLGYVYILYARGLRGFYVSVMFMFHVSGELCGFYAVSYTHLTLPTKA